MGICWICICDYKGNLHVWLVSFIYEGLGTNISTTVLFLKENSDGMKHIFIVNDSFKELRII